MHIAAPSRRTLAQLVAAMTLVLATGVVTTGVAGAGGTVHPDSANTCGGAVCIFVTGSGLNVSDWTTTASLSRSMCSTANFIVDGQVWLTGENTCGSAGDELGSDWSDPGNFANGTILCNTWSGISGEACITVHS
jgi:hypothetical protein